MAIQEKLAADIPAVTAYRKDLARSHSNLGNLLADCGRASEAEKQHRIALAVQENLAADFPTAPEYRQELGQSHNSLGFLLAGLGKATDAEEHYRNALAIEEKLAAEFPSVPAYRLDLALSHNSLGSLLGRLGQWLEAEEQYRKALAIQEKLAAQFRAIPEYQVELGGSYCNFGSLVRDRARTSESLDWFDKAIRALTAVYEQDHRLVLAKRYLRNSHFGRATSYDRLRRPALALNDWDRAIQLSPDDEKSTFRAGRAASRVGAGQTSEAVAEAAELTASQNWNASQWYSLARVYAVASGKVIDKKQAYGDRAMELLTQAVKAGFNDSAYQARHRSRLAPRPRRFQEAARRTGLT